MLAALRRLRSLTLWVTACVVLGPSALALCPDGAPAEAPPCHETGGTMDGTAMGGGPAEHGGAPDAPAHHEGPETACLSACCVAPTDLVDPAVVVSAPALAAALAVADVEAPGAPRAVRVTAARAHPPPGPTLLGTGRLRI